jgi:uncharacterized metal-binding protein YceD (DUF177 family)
MKILFDKVQHTIKDFQLLEDGLLFEGNLKRVDGRSIELVGVIKGDIELDCNRCGASFDHPYDAPIKLILSDQIVQNKDDLDIIEFLDGQIDIAYILESEINAFKSDYHYCSRCDNGEESFEMEF